jgi:uncharacterized protein YggE
VELSIEESEMRLLHSGAVVGALLVVAAPAAAKPVFVEADDAPDPRGLTVYGSGLARVDPPAQLNERTIVRAVRAAEPTAQERAMRGARRRAGALTARAGLTLGPVQVVRVGVPDAERFAGPVESCQTVRARATRRACGAGLRPSRPRRSGLRSPRPRAARR